MGFEANFTIPSFDMSSLCSFKFDFPWLSNFQTNGFNNMVFPQFFQPIFSFPQFNFWNNYSSYGNNTATNAPIIQSSSVAAPVDSFVPSGTPATATPTAPAAPAANPTNTTIASCKDASGKYNAKELYDYLHLSEQGLSYEVFSLAIEGYNNLDDNDKCGGYLGIFDTSQGDFDERYYLIDLNSGKIKRSEARTGSGDMSNIETANMTGSHATLSGFFKVGKRYHSNSKNRDSKVLKGLEEGINEQAVHKAVVIHHVIPGQRWTWGCIGYTPVMKNKTEIDYTATYQKMEDLFPEGAIIFTYPKDPKYRALSNYC